ncbi:MAG TPA: CrcB family protein, partial [Rhizomicrobium sp.]
MAATSPLAATGLVAIGGAIGSVLRHQAGRQMTHWLGAQTGTACPGAPRTGKVVGSLAMGLLAGFLARHGEGGAQWRLQIGVGLLGGFTTFSAFTLETVTMIERGQAGIAAFYALLSVTGA